MIKIEVLKKNEYTQIPRLYAECFEDEAWAQDWYLIKEFDPSGVFLIKKDKRPIGFVVSFLRQNSPYISVLGVKKSERNKGYAKALVDRVVEYYKDYKTFTLDVNKQRKKAVSFYQSYGFQIVKEDDQDYRMVYQIDRKFPNEIMTYTKGKTYEENSVGMTDSRILVFEDMVLKIEKMHEESINEARMLAWLQDKLSVPKLLVRAKEDENMYLLMEKLEGSMAFEEPYIRSPHMLVRMLAKALRMIWRVDITECPSDQSLDQKIRLAEHRVDKNLVDQADFDRAFLDSLGLKTPKEILAYLKTNRPKEELVFSHGDFCLPNYFFRGEELIGFIDLGRAGVSDLWQDLSLCIRSLKYNLGKEFKEEYIQLLMQELQIEFDQEKYTYFLLLDEVF